MVLAVAIVGLIGTLAASGAVSEWLRRRDLRESVKGDLEVYDKLPAGPARDRLLGRIETRVDSLGVERQPVRWITTVAVFGPGAAWLAVVLGVSWINGGLEFRRDDDGILRLYGVIGESQPFILVVLFIAGFVIALGVAGVLSKLLVGLLFWLGERALAALAEAREPKPTQTAEPPSASAQLPARQAD